MDLSQQRRKFYAGLVEDLVVFAGHVFRGDRKLNDGASARDHARSGAEQFEKLGFKKKPKIEFADEDSDAPECPPALAYLWRWFLEHSMGLASGGMGYPVVTWEGLAAWCEFQGLRLAYWEALAMVRLGQLRASTLSEKTSKTKPAGT